MPGVGSWKVCIHGCGYMVYHVGGRVTGNPHHACGQGIFQWPRRMQRSPNATVLMKRVTWTGMARSLEFLRTQLHAKDMIPFAD